MTEAELNRLITRARMRAIWEGVVNGRDAAWERLLADLAGGCAARTKGSNENADGCHPGCARWMGAEEADAESQLDAGEDR